MKEMQKQPTMMTIREIARSTFMTGFCSENIHQLQLDSAKDDFNIDNRVTQLETTVRVLKWVSVFLVSVVVMAISFATFILTHTI